MTEALQVGQFAIVDGEPADRGPNAGVFSGRGPAGDRAELFVVAEGTTPAGEAFAAHVVSALGSSFAHLDMSLTGGLKRLVREAAANVADWNAKSIAQHRVALGLTLFARRGDQSVLAQVGPSAAFLRTSEGLVRYLPSEAHARPLALDLDAVPQLTRIPFAPGDRLLLLSTAALRLLDDELLDGILRLPGEQALRELYHRLRGLRDVTVMLIQHPPAAEVETPVSDEEFVIDATDDGAGAPAKDAVQPSLFIEDDHQVDLERARRHLLEVAERTRQRQGLGAKAEEPVSLALAAGGESLPNVAVAHERGAAARNALLALAQKAQLQLAEAPSAEASLHAASPGRQSFSRSLTPPRTPPPPPPPPEADAPLAEELAEERRLSRRSASQPAGGESSALPVGGLRAEPLVRPRRRNGRWRSRRVLAERHATAAPAPPPWLVVVVGLAILVTLVGFLAGPSLFDGGTERRWEDLVQDAQERLALADVQTDPSERRRLLEEARASLLQARDLAGSQPEVEQSLTKVNDALAAMDAVRTPASVMQVGDLGTFGDHPITPTHLLVGERDAFLLDAASRQVVRQPLTGDPASVIFAADAEAGRGAPLAIALAEASEAPSETVYVLDDAHAVWAFDPGAGELRRTDIEIPSGASIFDMDFENGALYAIDPTKEVVYRFRFEGGGFGAAEVVLQSPDLAAARRLRVIGEEIYTTDANGTVHRFSGQLALTLSQAGIDEPLANPAPVQPFANGTIALADPANDRVVVLRNDGTFDHQYRHVSFQGLAAFAVGGETGYVFAGGQLWRVEW